MLERDFVKHQLSRYPAKDTSSEDSNQSVNPGQSHQINNKVILVNILDIDT